MTEAKPNESRQERRAAWSIPVWYDRATEWTWRGLVLATGALVALRVLSSMRIVVLPVFIAALLAAFMAPFRRALQRTGAPRLIAALLTFAAVVAAVGAVAWIVTVSIGDQLLYEAQWDVVRATLRCG